MFSVIESMRWVLSAYWLSTMVWKVMMSPSCKVAGSQVWITIRSPSSKVGDMEFDCTVSGVKPAILATVFSSLVASVVKA